MSENEKLDYARKEHSMAILKQELKECHPLTKENTQRAAILNWKINHLQAG